MAEGRLDATRLVTSRFSTLVRKIAPTPFRSAGPDTWRRARLLVGFIAALALLNAVFGALLCATEGLNPKTWTLLWVTVGYGMVFGLLRATGSVAIAGHTLCSVGLLGVVALGIFSPGSELPALVWCVPVPLIALFVIGRRAGVAWAVVSSALVFAFQVALPTGLELQPPPGGAWMVALSTVALIAVVTLLGGFFEAERQRTEGTLLRTQKHFRALIERSPAGIAVHQNGRFLFVNPSLSEQLGHSEPAALVGKTLRELAHPDAQAAVQAFLDGSQTDDNNAVAEWRCPVKGENHEFEWMAGPEVVFDEEVARIVVGRDVSTRKQMESRLRVAERMASLGTLAAGVGHELSNPLSFVVANLEFITRNLLPLTSGAPADGVNELQEAAREAFAGSQRMQEIVGELKVFGSPNSATPLRANVISALESAVDLAWTQIRHRAQLIRDYSPVPEVRAQPPRLTRIFLNLLVNAAQALPEDSSELGEIRLGVHTDAEGDAVVVVTDNGEGVDETLVGRVFDPFFTTKDVGQATGLGLSVCHTLVSALGGHIEFESEAGRGTTVRVTLPAAATLEQAAPVRRPADGTDPRRYLIVDDEPFVLRALKRSLRDYDVVEARSAREALELLYADREIGVVLCDLMMPGMSGMELYHQVKERIPGLEERMVFMTGGAFSTGAREFIKNVPNPILEKPFSDKDLQDAVAKLKYNAQVSLVS